MKKRNKPVKPDATQKADGPSKQKAEPVIRLTIPQSPKQKGGEGVKVCGRGQKSQCIEAPKKNHNGGSWTPKVEMLAELIPWTIDGPVGGIAGHWGEQEGVAFNRWLEALPLRGQGVFFMRNGKVWGVMGPPYGSPEADAYDADAGPDWQPVQCCRLPVIVSTAPTTKWHPSGAVPGSWIEKAKAAINEWEKTAPWEPEIGFIGSENALIEMSPKDGKPLGHGIMPPKDGKPSNWRKRALPVWNEHLAAKKRRNEEYEAKQLAMTEKAKSEDDGLGWMSPKYDEMFETAGIRHNGRMAWDFMQRGYGGIGGLLSGMWLLVLSPKWPRGGWTRDTFLGQIEKAFTASHSWLTFLYQRADTGDAELDKQIRESVGAVLTKHYARITQEWDAWNNYTNKARTKKANGNPNKGLAAPTDGFFRKALAGQIIDPLHPEEVKPFTPLPVDWFRSHFEAHRNEPANTINRRFVDRCINHAGFIKYTKTARKRQEVKAAYQARQKAAEANMQIAFLTPEEAEILHKPLPPEEPTFPRLTEEEFAMAWNRDGMPLADLTKMVVSWKKQHRDFADRIKNPLPIKGVMNDELSCLQADYETLGRTKDGKNKATYLAWVESDLLPIAREMFGLPREAPKKRRTRRKHQ